MNQLFTSILEFVKRLTGRNIQEQLYELAENQLNEIACIRNIHEKQLDEISRTRNLLIALIDHSTRSNKKTSTLDLSISIFQKDFSRYFQSHEKILEIVRSEPFSALNKWINQSQERERLSQYTIQQLTKRWESHAASLEETIERLQKEIDQKNKSLLQKLQESVSRRKP